MPCRINLVGAMVRHGLGSLNGHGTIIAFCCMRSAAFANTQSAKTVNSILQDLPHNQLNTIHFRLLDITCKPLNHTQGTPFANGVRLAPFAALGCLSSTRSKNRQDKLTGSSSQPSQHHFWSLVLTNTPIRLTVRNGLPSLHLPDHSFSHFLAPPPLLLHHLQAEPSCPRH